MKLHLHLALWLTTAPSSPLPLDSIAAEDRPAPPVLLVQWPASPVSTSPDPGTLARAAVASAAAAGLASTAASDTDATRCAAAVCVAEGSDGTRRWLSLALTSGGGAAAQCSVRIARHAVQAVADAVVAIFGPQVWVALASGDRATTAAVDKPVAAVMKVLVNDDPPTCPLLRPSLLASATPDPRVSLILARAESASCLPFSALSHNPYPSSLTSLILLSPTHHVAATHADPGTTARAVHAWHLLRHSPSPALLRARPCAGDGVVPGTLCFALDLHGADTPTRVVAHAAPAGWTLLAVLTLPSGGDAGSGGGVPDTALCPRLAACAAESSAAAAAACLGDAEDLAAWLPVPRATPTRAKRDVVPKLRGGAYGWWTAPAAGRRRGTGVVVERAAAAAAAGKAHRGYDGDGCVSVTHAATGASVATASGWAWMHAAAETADDEEEDVAAVQVHTADGWWTESSRGLGGVASVVAMRETEYDVAGVWQRAAELAEKLTG
ncbi:hypothetical protein H9P43_009559 [Blastocladiella emersonii ATCC 22665]|nr:hypothetical protein H9P43_009559 [Blastocladiella emersonii ATCC 22665]